MKITKKILALAFMAVAMVFTSCSKDDDNDPVVPTQQEIETKIIGKWKMVETRGEKVPTDQRSVTTYQANGKEVASTAKTHEMVGFVWSNKESFSYQITDNHVKETRLSNGMILYTDFTSITDNRFEKVLTKVVYPDGTISEPHQSTVFTKVTVDYSNDIIGLWEGVEMTGYETYGNAEARIEYRADGTYTYYKKEGDYWIPSANVDNEYNVDGDWLATRWRPEAGADYNYEWWDIDYIKDGTMKWSALREKEDGTRFKTTFTWKKIEKPSQQEIETKIIGKWKTVVIDGQECPTNNRAVFTFSTDGTYTLSISRYLEDISQSVWFNCETFGYKVDGNVITKEQWDDSNMYTEVYNITDDYFVEHHLKFQSPTMEYALDHVDRQKKVTADYSNDIIGMWEGVEMTGYETYGNAEARIEYRADGTYTYYKKEGDYWVPSANVGNEYNVDGDWLASRWRPEAGADYNYEWWDIDYIKKEGNDIIMKWSALREKEDGTRFTTTFTWKKVK